MAQSLLDSGLNKVLVPAWDAAYSAALVDFTPAITTATTDCQLLVITGVNNVVARVKRIRVKARLTTLAVLRFRLERWSTLGTLGSAVLTAIPTIANHGSPNKPGTQPNNPSVTPKSVGTAAYTSAGTTAGIFRQEHIVAKSTTVVDSPPELGLYEFGERGDNPIEIAGTTDSLVLIVYPPATASGAKFDMMVQWEESTVG